LLEAGADPFLRPKDCPFGYLTPFEKAVALGYVKIAQLLSVGRRVDVTLPSKGDMTLMDLAKASDSDEMLAFVRSVYAEHAIGETIGEGAGMVACDARVPRCSMGPM
jgi:hypothetical protein